VWCGVVSLFPDMFRAISDYGITRRAIERGLVELSCWNPRDFATDKHKTVDDRPYGGGPGMVMGVSPLRRAIQAAKASRSGSSIKTIYMSPQGKQLDQKAIQTFAKIPNLLLVSGRYEGVDERLIELEIDEEWSLGDYILTGGELAVMILIDAMTRLLPGALGHEASAACDSFSEGLLDYPHYTRPEMVDNLPVPEVLLGGDHKAIARWRLKQSLGRTWSRRPDLLEKLNIDKEHQILLQEFISEHKMQRD
jgi:tRNA (guanine37-N1)-methyltransferase